MAMLRVLLVVAGIFLVALGAGRVWNLKPAHGEADPTRQGQVALLSAPVGETVWLALDRRDTYRLQRAMSLREEEVLEAAAARKSAFPVTAGTEVLVVRVSSSKREVEVLEGDHAGMRGWVEFDRLQPARDYQRPIRPNPRRRY
jgi:hypothetical protein